LRELQRKLEIRRTPRVMPNEPDKPRVLISDTHADEPEKATEGEVTLGRKNPSAPPPTSSTHSAAPTRRRL
jgi:hypothetical protein